MEWLTLQEAADRFGCHYNTMYRNWSRLPEADRMKHGTQKFVSSTTRWRPFKRGRACRSYKGLTLHPKVREALPNCPYSFVGLPPHIQEAWMARIDAVLETPPD